MAATMTAYRLLEWGRPPELVEVPVPVAGPGQVVVRVGACGLCHSDLAMMAMPGEVGEALGWQLPFTLGHETAGWVHEVGDGVVGWSPGQAVAVVSPSSCGRCRHCRGGREGTCAAGMVGRGYGRDGGLASYLRVDDMRALVPIGGLAPRHAAPLTDAGATSHHAVARIRPHLAPGSVAVVVGVGGLGAFVVQILRATTAATVVALDPDPVRREVAARLGAHHVLDGVGEGTGRALRSLLATLAESADDPGGAREPAGADAVVDLVGTDDTIRVGLRALAPGGAFALVGAAGGTLRAPWYANLPRDGQVLTFQGSDLADAAGVLALAEAGQVSVDVVPHRLASVADAYAALDAGGLTGRIVVEP